MARGSPDQSAASWRGMASSTMPSRSAHSLTVIRSKPNSSMAVRRRVEPAGMMSARLASRPGRASPFRRSPGQELLVQRQQLVAAEAELVDRPGARAGAAGGHHPGQVAERAAAADGHRRLAGGPRRRRGGPARSVTRFSSRRTSSAVKGSPVTSSAERRATPSAHARRPLQRRAVADHDLEAAAAQVEAQRRARVDDHAGPHRLEDEPGLLLAADDPDLDAGLGGHAVDDLAAVLRLPEGGGGPGVDLLGAGAGGQLAEAVDGGHGPVGQGVGDATLAGPRRRRGAACPSPGSAGTNVPSGWASTRAGRARDSSR